MIHVTDSAFGQLQSIVSEQDDRTKGLRIYVERGGCAGLQYGMGLDHAKEGDEIVERDGLKVIIAADSADFLRGSTIDYADDLAGSGFRIKNPNAVRSCGCGTSFEPAEADAAARH
jgi:iron-sulfur cluster assembly accessory protein